MHFRLFVIGLFFLMNIPLQCSAVKLFRQFADPPDSTVSYKVRKDTILQDTILEKYPSAEDSTKKLTNTKPFFLYIPSDQSSSKPRLLVDSTLIAFNKRKQLEMIRLMAEGKISLGYFHIDYNRLFGYNIYEGIKLGLGGETNRLISRYFTIGGYFGYGLKDKSLHHGEWIDIFPTGLFDFRVHLGYTDMNNEFGGPEFLEVPSLLNPESYRLLLINNMFQQKRFTVGFEFRPRNDLDLYFFGDQSVNTARQNTPFLLEHTFDPVSLTRAGLQLRYSPGIKLQMENGHLSEITAPKADFYISIIQGFTILYGENSYTKLELKGKFDLPNSIIGKTTIMVRGGIMSQNAPIIELFNGYGSFAGTFTLMAPFSFATMRMNEFASANFVALHIRNDFSQWLFPENARSRPALVFAQNIGFGQLNDKYLALLNLHDYRKGFFESGVEVNNLLRFGYVSLGVGINYRYGPYQYHSVHDNFAYKFGFFIRI